MKNHKISRYEQIKNYAKILKNNKLINIDLRKKITPYFRRKIIDLCEGQNKHIYKMALDNEEFKEKKRLLKALNDLTFSDFNINELLDVKEIRDKIVEFDRFKEDGFISEEYYNDKKIIFAKINARKNTFTNKSNFGNKKLLTKKLKKNEVKKYRDKGLEVVNGYLISQGHSHKDYIKGIGTYEFNSGIKIPVLIKKINHHMYDHLFTPLLNHSEISKLFDQLTENGDTQIFPDSFIISFNNNYNDNKNTFNLNAMHNYVSSIINNTTDYYDSFVDDSEIKKSKEKFKNKLIDNFHILSNKNIRVNK